MAKTNKATIKNFVSRWTDKGYEKGQSQIFWIELLTDILGVQTPSEIISFEDQVKLDHTSFIDAYIQKTHVMIEQKSIDKDLRAHIKQSDGSMLTPFQQAKRYSSELPYSNRPRWIVTCNFKSFLIYDMEQPQCEPFEILLENLEKDYHHLTFLVEESNPILNHEMKVSIEAGEKVGKLYDAFLAAYGDNVTDADLHSLNVLCVRLVFCLYAEDADIFDKDQFVKYMQTFKPENMRIALRDLFTVLDTPIDKRDRFLEDKLKAFPYVNGALFKQQPGENIPPFTDFIANTLIYHAGLQFDWSDISPTIFGAVFESTLNQETRRKGGMHYTSIENIHKVIDPLFMNDLYAEFNKIKSMPTGKLRIQALNAFQDKIASLKFLDPACGSGNFLTETFISLRRLENEIIKCLTGGQAMMGLEEYSPIKVNIHQFYGIEINDFAASAATTALWIAESQMLKETESIVNFNEDFLPLKSYSNIKVDNSLATDWDKFVPEDLSYIIGNPPFIGHQLRSANQTSDMNSVFGKSKKHGKLDYVCAWFKKAVDLILLRNNLLSCAFVSTNSICQGESATLLWEPFFKKGIFINFAYQTFIWEQSGNNTTDSANVHCVIVGFSNYESDQKLLFEQNHNTPISVKHINAYLKSAEDIFIASRTKNRKIPKITKGSQPNGNFFITETEKNYLENKFPQTKFFIKKFIGADEFISGDYRYCLWLKGIAQSEWINIKFITDRIDEITQKRLSPKSSAGAKKAAKDRPAEFEQIRQPNTKYIVIPGHSSGNRKYLPIGFMKPDVICGNAVQIISTDDLYIFGILVSSIHMIWTNISCGRLKSDIRYNPTVYNSFPWPEVDEQQKNTVRRTAQNILDERNKSNCTLKQLYGDKMYLFPDLVKAHKQNDDAVLSLFEELNGKTSDSDIEDFLTKKHNQNI